MELSPRNWRVGLGVALVGLFAYGEPGALRVAHGSQADSDLGAMGFSLFFGLVVLIALAGLKSYRFDRNDGTYLFGTVIGRFRRPLSDIVAVQLITGRREMGDEDSPGFTMYQLNLVLRNTVAPRQNIAMTGALRETQFRGRALAEFLGVPLIDLIRVTKNDP